MKRHLLYMLGLLLPMFAMAQTDGYDPGNPPDPDWPKADTTTYYKVALEAIPDGAGQFNRDAVTMHKAGDNVNVYAYDHNGCYFHSWKDQQGNLLSEDRSYSFKMPAKDVMLYAIYSYTPDNPADPVLVGEYLLQLKSVPEVAASFNFQGGKVKEGTTQSLYAYPNSGFKLLRWEDQDGNVLGTEQRLSYLMPSHAATLTAYFDYEPETPANPSVNSWDEALGEVIVDHFTPGYLNSTIQQLVGSRNYDKVTHLIVDGQMNSSDFGFTNTFKKLTYVDLSRVAGIDALPSYTWDGNTDLQELELPSCISRIENYALRGCTSLRALNVYATVPPTLGRDVLKDVPADMVVYVPQDAVALYQAAEGWKLFDIQPLRSKTCQLVVTLPTECQDGRYKNMQLELLNVRSGARLRYVVTDRLSYTFPSLVRGTFCKAFLKNLSGHVLAETDTIAIDEADTSVTFSDMKLPRTLTLTVKGAQDADLTAQAEIAWTDDKGTRLAQGPTLAAQVAGQVVGFSVTLPQQLAMQYRQPEAQTYTVVEGDNAIELQLQPLPQISVKGQLVDATTGMALNDVEVTASQLLNGQYTVVTRTTTNATGDFTLVLKQAPTDMTFAKTDYVSTTIQMAEDDMQAEDGIMQMGQVKMRGITGAVVNLSLTWQACVVQDEEPTVSQHYNDYQNVSYTLFNITQQKAVTQFSTQYPKLVLLEEVAVGDQLKVTAQSNNGAFNDVSATCTVDEDMRCNVTLPLVERGGLAARFLITDNPAVVGALYDASGTLVAHAAYEVLTSGGVSNGENTVNFPLLKDGQYTLITMGQSDYFNTLFSLSNLGEAGLQQGVDYVQNTLSVAEGRTTALRNVVIPVFDESKFYYTGQNTSFTVNRANVIQGNYLTLNARVDFRDQWKQHVSDVALVFQLPATATMVEGSVLLGRLPATYELNGNTVTVPLGDNFTDRVRLCIVPTERGNYTPSAYVRFQLDGQTVMQPIGTTAYTVTDMTIWAPALISTPALQVNGNAAAMSDVTLYDGQTVIGQTKALADGYWAIETALQHPYNLSMHEIYAEVKTPAGVTVKTETRPVEYNIRSIQAKTVEMSFYNDLIGVQRTIYVKFDLQHITTSSPSYMFQGGKTMVFTADLTNNSPEVVQGCVIRVFTNNHEWIDLPARYIPNMDRWVANGSFTTHSMPIGVRVEVDADISEEVDYEELQEQHQLVVIDCNVKHNTMDVIAAMPDEDTELVDDDVVEPAGEDTSLGYLIDMLTQLGQIASQIPSTVLTGAAGYDPNALLKLAFQDWDDTRYEFYQCSAQQIDLSVYDADTIRIGTTMDGMPLTIYVSHEGSLVIILGEGDNATAIGINLVEQPTAAPRRARIATDLVTALKQKIGTLEQAVSHVNQYIETLSKPIRKEIADINTALSQEETLIHQLKGYREAHPDEAAAVDAQLAEASKQVAQMKKHRAMLSASLSEVSGYINIIRQLNCLMSFAHYGIQDVNQWQAFIDRLLPCNGLDDAQARALSWICEKRKQEHGWRYITAVDIAAHAAALMTTLETTPEGIKRLDVVAAAMSQYLMTFALDVYKENKAASRNHLRKAKRDRNGYNCAYAEQEVIDPKWDFSLPYPVVEPIIDPSGFVYEGVESNRLEGVTATAYYKHSYEDMYGDPQEEIVLWDASLYSQENPLLTDAQGMYQWDVPQGLWQVKFEKEGYQTAYSEWLPVPPPQMDVNIGMVQLAQPEVVRARAYNNGEVELTFSKYMRPQTLTPANIFVKGVLNGVETLLQDVQVSCPDQQAAIVGSADSYARQALIATGDLNQYDEIYVIVSRAVESYAGIQMAENYQQKIDIERRLTTLAADTLCNVAYDGQTTLRIAALPTEAAAGKKVLVRSADAKIVTLGEDKAGEMTLTLDADGQATLTLSGALYGQTALQMQVLDEDITAQTIVNVVDPAMLEEVKPALASHMSGTALYRGQSVALTCETEGATIWYTLDGTCPCSSQTRMQYRSPIVINQPLTLQVMAIGINGTESEVSQYRYQIRQSQVTMQLAEGWNWTSHDVADGVPTAELLTVADEVLTQDDGAISVMADEAVKMRAGQTTTKTFIGDQYNPTANNITLHAGWNWLGYPLDQMLTLGDALAYLTAEDGDVVANLDGGFAMFADGQWRGMLKAMQPGQGYLYRSASDKGFAYNPVATVNARALYGPATQHSPLTSHLSPLTSHLYPDLMCITAQVYDGGQTVDATLYEIGAFVGEECRGVAQVEDGLVFLPVHGSQAETITFAVINRETGQRIAITDTVTFTADVLGTVSSPYHLNLIDGGTGIDEISSHNSEFIIHNSGHIYDLQGRALSGSDGSATRLRSGIYVRQGKKVVVNHK